MIINENDTSRCLTLQRRLKQPGEWIFTIYALVLTNKKISNVLRKVYSRHIYIFLPEI